MVRADDGEEGKREAREGRGMLRSRGNRLPSERAVRLSSPSHSTAAARWLSLRRAAPLASPSLVFGLSLSRAPSTPRGPLRFFSSPSPRPPLSLSLSSSLARKRIGLRRRFLSFPPPLPPTLSGISSPDRLYRPVDFSSAFRDRASRWSSAIAATRHTYTYAHTHTHRHHIQARRIVPAENRAFFRTPGRDSSPISFQSPVIN